MRAVNLLPSDLERARRSTPRTRIVLAAAAPVIAGSLVVAGWSLEHDGVLRRQSDLASVNARIAAVQPAGRDAAATQNLVSLRTQRLASLSAALRTRVAWDRTLQQLARVLPEDVWLTSVSLQSPGAATASPTPFTLAGTTRSHDSVAQLLARLQLLPALSGVQLASSTAGPTSVEFSITANGAPEGIG
jgi:Tfp pilus assembly protein PilN